MAKRTGLRVTFTVLALVLVIAALAGTKVSQFAAMSAQAAEQKPPPATVAVATVQQDSWQPVFETFGTVVPVRGVTLHAEVAGTVKRIFFESGAPVKAGDLLVLLDTSTQQAQLASAQASAELGKTTLSRIKNLEGNSAVSVSQVDSANAQAKQADAEVQRLSAEIGKRALRAPFDGHLGIWPINLGQFLNIGDEVNSVTALDPTYVDFTLPQQALANVAVGLTVQVKVDAFPDATFTGKLSAINPGLDASTRSVYLRATLSNPEGKLRPGMFTHVIVVQSAPRKVLTVPATAVIYAPYGDSVFVVDEKDKQKVARQSFVRLGERRGDMVEVTKGLTPTDTVVTTGAFKLRNGTTLVINNELAPKTSTDPKPADN
jgi:membrane fusion protein (multidrug efflux system)